MQKVSILHLFTSAKNVSPFDVNMAYDAGFDKIMPYTNLAMEEIVALTQDAMFSRSITTKQSASKVQGASKLQSASKVHGASKMQGIDHKQELSGVQSQALFFGGRDIHLALSMQKAAVQAMFTPFELSTMSDPSGAFTTASSMMAKIDNQLIKLNHQFAHQTIAIFGASGTVGTTAALIAANLNANVQLVAHDNIAKMCVFADRLLAIYGVALQVVDGTTDAAKTHVLNNADIAICAATTGVRVIEVSHYAKSPRLKIMADVNAVAPSGVAELNVTNDGDLIANTQIAGFGALAIGQLKYKTQQKLLQNMLANSKPMHLDFRHAFEVARNILSAHFSS